MNKNLDNLFYTEKLGIGNKTTFIKNVRERHPDIKVKDIQEYLKNQEVNQINTTVNKSGASACACIRGGFGTFAWTSVGR